VVFSLHLILNPEELNLQLLQDTLKEFYCSDEFGRVMPDKKDFVTVKASGTETHESKGSVHSF
jgi:hypothetical protein